MAERPTFRWWQEQEPPSEISRQASERVALSAAPMAEPELEPDTWAELEAEALRRGQQTGASDAESVSIYIDRQAALRQRKRDRFFLYLFTVWNLIFFASLCWLSLARNWEHPEFWVSVSIVMTGYFLNQSRRFFTYFERRNEFLRTSEVPAVRLSPKGIHLGTPEHWDVLLPWDKINSINTKKIGKYGRLEIVDVSQRWFVIEEHYLPMTAGTLYAEIAAYKAARQIA